MKQVELLDVPAPHVPYTRVPLPKSGLRIGGTGSDVQVQSILGYCRLELVGGQIQARKVRVKRQWQRASENVDCVSCGAPWSAL